MTRSRQPLWGALALCTLLAACVTDPADDTHEGIAVGNPGVVAMSLAAADGFNITKAELPVQWVGFAACSGTDVTTPVGGTTDLALAPLSVSIPAGAWCGVVVRFSGDAALEASWEDGVEAGTMEATVLLGDVELVVVDTALAVDEDTALALELASPDWLNPAALGLLDGALTTITTESPAHAVLVDAVVEESALFDDLDGSGLVDLPERDAGALALPGQIALNPDAGSGDAVAGLSSGCSCSTGEGRGGWGLALLLLLPLLRRRVSRGAGRATRSRT
ncbi:MAG: hypothetical protein KDA24_01605 [Deltaproteobacteria bacterium]|nr:hypothetical protein [Deltaproteobacteria bacterium]